MCCVYGRLLFVYNKKKTKTSNPLITLTVKLLINWMEFFDLFLVNERSAFVRACVRARARPRPRIVCVLCITICLFAMVSCP